MAERHDLRRAAFMTGVRTKATIATASAAGVAYPALTGGLLTEFLKGFGVL